MKKWVIASTRRSAGKTTLIAGMMQNMAKAGYIKPFGDRPVSHNKQMWDYDAGVMNALFSINSSPTHLSLGFDHAKMHYQSDEATVRKQLTALMNNLSQSFETVFVEGGMDLAYGVSAHLDVFSLAKHLEARLALVVGGNDYCVMDDLHFIHKHMGQAGVRVDAVIVNKSHTPDVFKKKFAADVAAMEFPLIGVVPFEPELTYFTAAYLARHLGAEVISGEEALTDRVIKHVFVGAMSASLAQENPLFKSEKKMIITSGDRVEMILAAIETDTAAIVLTNKELPPPSILAQARQKNIPILSVPIDTYSVAKKIEAMESLLATGDAARMQFVKSLIAKHVDFAKLA